jgi:hypothetical protein
VITAVLLFVLLTGCCYGQFIGGYGIKGGITWANQEGSFGENRTGVNIGFFLHSFPQQSFSLISSLEYTQRGGGVSFDDLRGGDTWYLRLDYLTLPVLGRMTFSVSKASIFFLAGPRLDLLLNTGGDERLSSHPLSDSDNYNRFVLGGTVGFGVNIPTVWRISSFLEFRYNGDFRDATKLGLENSAFDILLGLNLAHLGLFTNR